MFSSSQRKLIKACFQVRQSEIVLYHPLNKLSCYWYSSYLTWKKETSYSERGRLLRFRCSIILERVEWRCWATLCIVSVPSEKRCELHKSSFFDQFIHSRKRSSNIINLIIRLSNLSEVINASSSKLKVYCVFRYKFEINSFPSSNVISTIVQTLGL